MKNLTYNMKDQNYCKRNYPKCFEPIDETIYYPEQKEIDLEVRKLMSNQLRNALKLH